MVIDVNVGLPRCGCDPADAGRLAERARARGLAVRGVMGYEGHAVGLEDRARRAELAAAAMELLVAAHGRRGRRLVSAGGTGTYDINTAATEIQAGSYALMDGAYTKLGLPFGQALTVLATVVSVSPRWAVADCGAKALGMDHGNPDGGRGRRVVLLRRAPHLRPRTCPWAWVIASGWCRRTSTRPSPITSAWWWSTATTCSRRGRWTCGAGSPAAAAQQ